MGDYRPIDPREPQAQQQAQWQAPQQQPWTGQQPPYPGPEQQSQWQQPPQPWTGQQPQWQQPPYPGPMMGMGMQKSWITTVLLCQFVGTLGIHRFYTGRIVSGIFQLLTFGGFGIWTLIDLIMIYTDSFTDDRGMPLTRMEGVRPNVYMRNPQVKDCRAFWFTRTTAKACHTVTAKLPLDARKNGASAKPHWERGANPSKRGLHH